MAEEHLPLHATHDLPRIPTDVPLPPRAVAPMPRPGGDEPSPFHA